MDLFGFFVPDNPAIEDFSCGHAFKRATKNPRLSSGKIILLGFLDLF